MKVRKRKGYALLPSGATKLYKAVAKVAYYPIFGNFDDAYRYRGQDYSLDIVEVKIEVCKNN